jgi:hypothetical protein
MDSGAVRGIVGKESKLMSTINVWSSEVKLLFNW